MCYLPKPKAEADNTNRGLNNSSYPTRTEFNNCFIIYLYLRIVLLFICIFNFGISSISHMYFAFGISSINWCDVIRSNKCFQNTNKLRHNVQYVFSIFYDDVITPNFGHYRTDITISSTALNQSKLLNYFQ